jgi:hypothetical protein
MTVVAFPGHAGPCSPFARLTGSVVP